MIGADILAATKTSSCRCEDEEFMSSLAPHVRGYLRPGMRVADLRALCGGCTTPTALNSPIMGVCSRLDAIRRRYGR